MDIWNVPFAIHKTGKLRLALETECFTDDLELSLAGLRCDDAVKFLVLSIQYDEVPFLYRTQNDHLIYVMLGSSLEKFFPKVFRNFNWNICEWNSQSQQIKS
jgi:hypothetical protein